MRPSEWLLIGYFCYTAVLSQVLPVRMPIPVLTPLLNLTLFATYALMAWAHALRRSPYLGIMRDWFSLPMLLLTYRQMGWFAQTDSSHALERRWVEWDRAVLNGGLRSAIECAGPVFPMLLELAYLLVYTLGPFSLAMVYFYRRRDRVEQFLFLYVTAVVLCYAQYPLWPSEPPRTVFPGQDLPAFDSVFRRFNLWYLGGQGIHTSVFPSTHVASAFAAAFGLWRTLPEHPWVSRAMLVMAILIATATVYGRYHYLADATAGFFMAVVALGASALLHPALDDLRP